MVLGGRVTAAELLGTVDFAIITIRDDEFRAVLRFFPPSCEAYGLRTYEISTFTTLEGKEYRAALLKTFEQGHGPAQSAASDVITDLDPTWLVLVGIGGAVPEFEFSLGDVVVANRLHDFSITAALAGGRTELDSRGSPAHRAVQILVSRLPALEARLAGWSSPEHLAVPRPPVALADENFRGDDAWKQKVRSALEHHFGTLERASREPLVTAAATASGNVLMKDPAVLQEWLKHARSIKSVEMEAPGIYEAARSRHGDKPVLAIRGISDVVGFSRDPRWTEYACVTAASLARALLGTGPIEPRLKGQSGFRTVPDASRKMPALSVGEFDVQQVRDDYPVAVVGTTLTNDELVAVNLKELVVTVRALWDLPGCMTGDLHPVIVPTKGARIDLIPAVGSRHEVTLDLKSPISPGQRSGFRVSLFSRKALNAEVDEMLVGHPYGVVLFLLEIELQTSHGVLRLPDVIANLCGYLGQTERPLRLSLKERAAITDRTNEVLMAVERGAVIDARVRQGLTQYKRGLLQLGEQS